MSYNLYNYYPPLDSPNSIDQNLPAVPINISKVIKIDLWPLCYCLEHLPKQYIPAGPEIIWMIGINTPVYISRSNPTTSCRIACLSYCMGLGQKDWLMPGPVSKSQPVESEISYFVSNEIYLEVIPLPLLVELTCLSYCMGQGQKDWLMPGPVSKSQPVESERSYFVSND